MIRRYRHEKNPFSTGFFSMENYINNIDMFDNLAKNLSNEELYDLFIGINKSQNNLIEYIYYDYKNYIYEALTDTVLEDQANDLSNEITDKFMKRDMDFVYYSLLLKHNRVNYEIDNSDFLYDDKGYVINFLHYSIFHLVPYLIATNTEKEVIMYANKDGINYVYRVMKWMNYDQTKNITMLPVDYKSAITSMKKVKNGALLLILPEIDRGGNKANKEVHGEFLGQKINFPIGAQKIAEVTKSEIKLSYLDIDKNSTMKLKVESIENVLNTKMDTIKLWSAIERVVTKKPSQWTIWEMWRDIKIDEY